MTVTAASSRSGPPQGTLPFGDRALGPSPYRPSRDQLETGEVILRHAQRMLSAESGLTTLIVTGPAGAGKTRLAEEAFAGLPAAEVELLDPGSMSAADIFAAINHAAAGRCLLILESRKGPEAWFADEAGAFADLQSRLVAAPKFTLDRPSADALEAVLRADLALHGQRLSQAEIKRLADDLPRHFAAPRRVCRALEEAGTFTSRKDLLQWASEQAHVRADEPGN